MPAKCCTCSKEIGEEHIVTLVTTIDPAEPSGFTRQYHYCRTCAPSIKSFEKNPANNAEQPN